MPGHIREFNRLKQHSSDDLVLKIWRNNNTEATWRVFCLWLWITSVLASTEEGGAVREINYIYAIPCPTGPRYVPSSGSSSSFFTRGAKIASKYKTSSDQN